jgi:hypothetical protein
MTNQPVIQINEKGFKSLAHELAELNEKDAAGKKGAGGKATAIATHLRYIYRNDIKSAQIKIHADIRNGSPPYIAPGIYEIIGYAKYDKDIGFPPDAGVPRWLMGRVLRNWGFPQNIRSKTNRNGQDVFRDPFEALDQYYQQNL